MELITEALAFAAPCWIVNLALNGIYVGKLYFPQIADWDKPLDNKVVLPGGQRLLGESTTWFGIPVALLAGSISQILFTQSQEGLLPGVLLGLLVYSGHAMGSFIKRRLKYQDGQYMPLVDHGDYIILTGLAFGIVEQFTWKAIGLGVLITYLIHPIVTYIAYLHKWHKYPL